MSDWQMIQGDCLDVLPTLADVDLFVTSPPYNQGIQSFKPSGMHKETRWIDRIATAYQDQMPEQEYQQWQVAVCDACWDVAVENASLFYNHKVRWRDRVPIFPITWLGKTKWTMRQEVVWSHGGSTTLNCRMFPPADERIYWMRKHQWKWRRVDTTWSSIWKIKSAANSVHPVAFPVEIPHRAIACCTDPGDLVVDPFAGSGTTGVACVRLGRRFIGIEIDQHWYEVACERLERAERGLSETEPLEQGTLW